MIRFRRINRAELQAWLVEQTRERGNGSYHLRVWREDALRLDAVRAELLAYFQETLDDARRRLRTGFEDELSPFTDPQLDPTANYPAALHRVTLQGYLGETFAALAVEHWDIHGRGDWSVPALLFRFHEVEFQHLERINQRLRDGQLHMPDAEGEQRPGRTGDDAIAFVKDNANNITHVLTLEAKCISRHRVDTLNEAHQKLNEGPSVPDSIRELVELLNQYDTPEAQMWQEALVKYRASGGRNATRYDAVVYVCGQRPSQGGRVSWMSSTAANAAYTLTRALVGLEYHVENLAGLVETIYRT
jgi:hypothetical protein